MTLVASDAWGRPGRGGGGARPGSAGAGGAGAAGSRPNAGNAGGPKAKTPSGKLGGGQGNVGQGNHGKNSGARLNNPNGQFGKGSSNVQRATNQQLQDFLGQKADGPKSGDFQRDAKGTRSPEQFQAQASQIQSNVQGRASDLFTPQWYAQHPNAWQATHPHADAWAVATAASVAAWVGTAAYGGGSDTIIVDSGNTTESTESTDESASDEDASEPSFQSVTDALAATDSTQLLPLGVFALAQDGQTEPTTLIQLAVDKQGQISGSYYDLVSDNGTPVAGQLDANTQRAAWSAGENSKNVFAASVDTLTGDSGPVTLHMPNGKTQDWNLIRLKQPAGQTQPAAANSR
jgi:hypothetical protein